MNETAVETPAAPEGPFEAPAAPEPPPAEPAPIPDHLITYQIPRETVTCTAKCELCGREASAEVEIGTGDSETRRARVKTAQLDLRAKIHEEPCTG